jgi:hypothetical protein
MKFRRDCSDNEAEEPLLLKWSSLGEVSKGGAVIDRIMRIR